MQYGLLTYNFVDRFNVGDYIQSLAARQFLPRVDHYLNRERLHEFSGPEVKVILNGWFMRHPEHFPLSSSLHPLFISFHLNLSGASEVLSEKGVAYLKQHEPIGCRDLSTLRLLEEKNIRAYYSSCLTLTLGSRYHHEGGDTIYFVDVLYKHPTLRTIFKSFNSFCRAVKRKEILLLGRRKKIMEQVLGSRMMDAAAEITHVYPANAVPTEEGRLELADQTLKRYEKAKLVVTSRIHCALPCLAMGTPVIFINGGFHRDSTCRFDGLADLFHAVHIQEDGRIETNFDLAAARNTLSLPPRTEHVPYIQPLRERCLQFIRGETVP